MESNNYILFTVVLDICNISWHIAEFKLAFTAAVPSNVAVGPLVVNCSKSKRILHIPRVHKAYNILF